MKREQTATPAGFRPATPEETQFAIQMLQSQGETLAAKFVELDLRTEPGGYMPIVVSDFAAVPDNQHVLLVPEGTYSVPRSALNQEPRFIISLSESGKKPVLMLDDGEMAEIMNLDTSEESKLALYRVGVTRFAGVAFDAPRNTVVETVFLDDRLFSDHLFLVDCSPRVDVLCLEALTFMEGRAWALHAYGEESYGARSASDRVFDGVSETVLSAIDAVFKPIVALAERIDKALDLK